MVLNIPQLYLFGRHWYKYTKVCTKRGRLGVDLIHLTEVDEYAFTLFGDY